MNEPHVQEVPQLDEARSWRGRTVDDASGHEVGTANGVFVDAATGAASWLAVKFRRGRFASSLVVVPAADCAGGGGRIWVAHEREAIRSSPVVDSRRPLLREHELALCEHYGIGGGVGRAAKVIAQAEGAITSQPLR